MPTTVVGCGGCICGVERRDRGARAAAAGCGLTATGKSSWWISPCSGGRVDVIDRAYAMSVDLAVFERQARLVRHKLPCRCPHRDCPAGAVTGAGPAAVRGQRRQLCPRRHQPQTCRGSLGRPSNEQAGPLWPRPARPVRVRVTGNRAWESVEQVPESLS